MNHIMTPTSMKYIKDRFNELVDAHNELVSEHDRVVLAVNELCDAVEAIQGLFQTEIKELDS